MTRRVPSVCTVAAAVAVVGAVILVTLAVVLVPWHPVPGGGPSTLPAPDTVLSPEQLARAEAYAGPARWLGWSSLLVSLGVVCWLGFTEAGARLVNRDRMWHYVEGLPNHSPVWPGHGIRILPGPSSLWLDATGRRLPAPYLPGFDTLGTLTHLRTLGCDTSQGYLHSPALPAPLLERWLLDRESAPARFRP